MVFLVKHQVKRRNKNKGEFNAFAVDSKDIDQLHVIKLMEYIVFSRFEIDKIADFFN